VNKLKIKKVKNKNELDKVFEIRTNVFVKEQNVPIDLEMDGLDREAEHFIAYVNNKPIGCARIRIKNNFAKLERIAIIKEHRNKGFGKQLTKFLIDYCKQKKFDEIRLHSQIYVSDFYKKLGFKPVGENFFEAGIAHIEMYMKIN
jgi:predicted GNAT family N-acyltransferase